jgi:phospholipid/cholesterol/gamma-HCH transport system substrate-binding protein
MLVSLQHLGDVATHVVRASHDDLVANLRHLRPTLGKLAEVGQDVPKILEAVATYPTADSVENEYFGDYGNLALTLDVSAKSLLNTFGPGGGFTLPATGSGRAGRHRQSKSGSVLDGVTGGLPSLPGPVTRWAPGTTIDDLLLGALS